MYDTAPAEPRTVFLKDYTPPAFTILSTTLHFVLGPLTTVRATLHIQRAGAHQQALRLDGEALELGAIQLDGEALKEDAYTVDEQSLTIATVPDDFVLEIETSIRPEDNSELSGLYKSAHNYCSQCEAEGFRRITYYLDRPDVLSRFTTTIDAEREQCPVLLSNGNLIEQSDLGQGWHRAVWQDPFPKPSYLFALVAGPLQSIQDKFTTRSGRDVALFIYTEPHNITKCDHAMASLKKAMRWDEQNYGREYDLDRYMIVAVDDFNMGAMENKGLNVFNTQFVLADPETATDMDYLGIEGVIGHEYFHNWSGNRVTCRDWFQLSLKEGFTVFRDQQFSEDMVSTGYKRIHDVNLLRTHQFREDAGPMAHPVRPGSYQEINNFYTTTVYNKGAEVVRMLYHLLGAAAFRKGTDHYFDKFDGQAVTTDDFVDALEQANDVKFDQFRRWYDQAGTPLVELTTYFDPEARTFTFHATQSCPPTPGQAEKKPFQIPIAVALLDSNGRPLPFTTEQGTVNEAVLDLRQSQQSFVLKDVAARPVPSVFRRFSAPVKFSIDLSPQDWYFLMAHDDDPFSCWEAGQHLALQVLLGMIEQIQNNTSATVPDDYVAAFNKLLNNKRADRAFHAETLVLPSEAYIAETLPMIDPDAVHTARQALRRKLANALHKQFLQLYEQCHDDGEYQIDAGSIGKRALKNICLAYLSETNQSELQGLVKQQFSSAHNMTDTMAALRILCDQGGADREQALAAFYEKWSGEALVINKWFAAQATSSRDDTLDRLKLLTEHPAFSIRNPNKVRSLLGAFAHANPARFHDRSGEGYRWIADYVLQLDEMNPQIAARLVSAFNSWRRYDEHRQGLICTQLERILSTETLSADVREIASKSLAPQ